MTPDKLPEEIIGKIEQKAEDFANSHVNGRTQRDIWELVFKANRAGATAWAPWKVKHDELKADYDLLASDFNKLLQQKNTLATVLQEFVSKHEAGLLPDRFVYENAIKILNDGK